MRHKKYGHKLGVSPSHRKALMKNLSISLIEHGKIKSTLARCKALRGYVEKLVTIAKEDTVANRRLAYSKLNNKVAVKNLFENLGPKFKERKGGYTRVIKIADRRVSDGSTMSQISFVD